MPGPGFSLPGVEILDDSVRRGRAQIIDFRTGLAAAVSGQLAEVDATGGGGGVAGVAVDNEFPAITDGTTSFVLAHIPLIGSEHLYRRGKRLQRVDSAPGVDEYTILDDTVTVGWTLLTVDVGRIWADYRYAGSGPSETAVDNEFPDVTPGETTLALAVSPSLGSEHVYRRGKRLQRVDSGPAVDEYTISGNVITTGWVLLTTDVGRIWADYRY